MLLTLIALFHRERKQRVAAGAVQAEARVEGGELLVSHRWTGACGDGQGGRVQSLPLPGASQPKRWRETRGAGHLVTRPIGKLFSLRDEKLASAREDSWRSLA